MPSDLSSSFEPELVKKDQTCSSGMDSKIIHRPAVDYKVVCWEMIFT
jgi:transposase-like protein